MKKAMSAYVFLEYEPPVGYALQRIPRRYYYDGVNRVAFMLSPRHYCVRLYASIVYHEPLSCHAASRGHTLLPALASLMRYYMLSTLCCVADEESDGCPGMLWQRRRYCARYDILVNPHAMPVIRHTHIMFTNQLRCCFSLLMLLMRNLQRAILYASSKPAESIAR